MLPLERKLMDWIGRRRLVLCFLFATAFAWVIRWHLLDFPSDDMERFLIPWFTQIRDNGGLRGIQQQVGNYNVAYQIIIALLTYLPGNPMRLIKFASIGFDYFLALCVGKLAYDISERKGENFVLGYSIVLLLPTVFLNSAAWGQCDAIYSSFCVLSADLFILNARQSTPPRKIFAFVMLGFAFAMKLQAAFLLPFVMYLYFLCGSFSLLHFLIPLGINVLLPMLAGRAPLATFTIYSGQMDPGGTEITKNAPSIWLYLARDGIPMYKPALLLTLAIFGVALVVLLRKPERHRGTRRLVFLLLWSCWTCVTFLPVMHDRYNYLVEVLFIALALLDARALPFAIATEMAGIAAYGNYLSRRLNLVYPESLSMSMLGCVLAYLCFTAMLYWHEHRRRS